MFASKGTEQISKIDVLLASVRTLYRLPKKGATAFYVKVLFSTDLKMRAIGTIPTVSKW